MRRFRTVNNVLHGIHLLQNCNIIFLNINVRRCVKMCIQYFKKEKNAHAYVVKSIYTLRQTIVKQSQPSLFQSIRIKLDKAI